MQQIFLYCLGVDKFSEIYIDHKMTSTKCSMINNNIRRHGLMGITDYTTKNGETFASQKQ